MDILSIQPDTITLDLKHPATGKLLGVTIELRSMESVEVRAVQRQIQNKALKAGRNSTTAEKIEDNTIAILSATIVSWVFADDVKLGDLKNPPCNEENKRKLLSISALAKQIDEALGDETAFFKG